MKIEFLYKKNPFNEIELREKKGCTLSASLHHNHYKLERF